MAIWMFVMAIQVCAIPYYSVFILNVHSLCNGDESFVCLHWGCLERDEMGGEASQDHLHAW